MRCRSIQLRPRVLDSTRSVTPDSIASDNILRNAVVEIDERSVTARRVLALVPRRVAARDPVVLLAGRVAHQTRSSSQARARPRRATVFTVMVER